MMTLTSCPRENEVRDLLVRSQWPPAADAELRAHAALCRACGDLVLVSQAFQKARAETLAAARLPAPGILFWRAQLRRRYAAVERVTRPLLGAEIFALVVALLTALGFGISQARHGIAWLTWVEQLEPSGGLHWSVLLSLGQNWNQGWTWMILLPGIGALALLGGLAVYLASEKQ
jgi:hypothetical protein